MIRGQEGYQQVGSCVSEYGSQHLIVEEANQKVKVNI